MRTKFQTIYNYECKTTPNYAGTHTKFVQQTTIELCNFAADLHNTKKNSTEFQLNVDKHKKKNNKLVDTKIT